MKSLVGKIISTKMKDTIVVEVERSFAHPRYAKRVYRNRKYHAHDTVGAKVGDMVSLVETRPISKTKFYKLFKII